MKKNFAKKLATVLSLTMAASLVVPAMPASAATAPDLKTRRTYVYEGNDYSYTAINAKGYTVKWSVSGEGAEFVDLSATKGTKTVLTVATEGNVAAKLAPVAVKAKFYKDGKLQKTRTDNVNIKVSATGVAITETATVAAGETTDFNRTLTPANATSKTYWTVTDKNDKPVDAAEASIDAAGVLKTTKVGEYKVVATVRNAKDSAVVATDSQPVKVILNMSSATQTTDKALKATFTTSVKDIVKKDNFKIVVKDAAATVVPVSAVAFSEDGKEVTISTFTSLKDNTDYTLTFTDADKNAKSLDVHATIGAVKDIQINPATVNAGEETAVTLKFVNAAGVDITNIVPTSAYSLSVEVQNGYYDAAAKKILLLAKDNTAKVKVTLYATEFDKVTGAPTNELVKEGVITAVDKAATTFGSYEKYTVATAAPSNWDDATNNQLSLSDGSMKIFVKAKDSTNTAIDTTTTGGFTYTSSDLSKLIINDGNTLVPVSEGLVYIVAKNTTKNIEWTIPVYVVGARKASVASLDNYTLTLSNAVVNSKVAKFSVKDQYQAAMAVTVDQTVSVLAKPSTTMSDATATSILSITGDSITVSGLNLTAGTYRFVVKGNTANGSLTQVLTVVVQAPTGTVKTYDLVLDKTSVDTTVTSTSTDLPVVNVRIAEYTGGVISGYTTGSVTVYAPDNSVYGVTGSSIAIGTTNATPYVFDTQKSLSAAGAAQKCATGTYKVVATVGNKTFTKYITVVDNQASLPSLTVKSITAVAGSVSSMLATALEIKSGTNVLAVTDYVTKPVNTTSVTAGNSVFVEKVAVSHTIGSVTFECWLPVNTTITATAQ